MEKKSVKSITSVVLMCLMIMMTFAVSVESVSAATSLKKKVGGVTAVAKSSSSIKIAWNKLKKSTGYRIYRSSSPTGKFKRVKTVLGGDTLSWTNKKLKQSTTYYYKVKPINGTKYSDVASATTEKKMTFKDYAPTTMLDKDGEYTVVSWTDVKDADGYRVYRKNPDDTKFKRIAQVSADTNSFKDNKGESGKMVEYKVRAYKGFLTKKFSSYSKIVSIQTVHRVFIACGHGTDIVGNWDSGCTYKGMSEAALMLPITKSMVAALRRSGVIVYTDADANNNKNMIACVTWSKKKAISAYVSIHCDYSKAPSGTLPLYKAEDDKKLAKALNSGVHSMVKIPNRGLSRRTDLYELNYPKVPACIFETGGIKYDNKVFRKKAKQYGEGMAKGMCEYLGVDYAN